MRLTISSAAYSGSLLAGYGANSGGPGDVPLLATLLESPGLIITPTATNEYVGETYIQVPSGSTRTAQVSVQGVNSYSYQVTAEDVKLSITANGTTLARDKVVTDANFIVGQMITFSTNWINLPSGIASKTVQWKFEGNFLNDSNQPCADCSVNYTTNLALLTSETNTEWWVSGANPAATYTAQLNETLTLENGSIFYLHSQGMFNMYRPQVVITAVTSAVALDTNYYDGSTYKFGLHYGVASGSPGILLTSAVTVPGGFSTNLQWIQVITSTLRRYRTNDGSGSWYQLQAINVIDRNYPYEGPTDNDSPGQGIDDPYNLITDLSVSDEFGNWLEYRPTSTSQWVPLTKVTWSWGGSAVLSGTDVPTTPADWTALNLTNAVSVPDAEVFNYPWWTNSIANPLFKYNQE